MTHRQAVTSLTLLFIMVFAFVCIGCDGIFDNDKEVPPSYEPIPEAAKQFADQHWDASVYQDTLYASAADSAFGQTYTGTREQWDELNWAEKLDYLPVHMIHELPPETNDNYYAAIAVYLDEFGFGWDDATGDDLETRYFFDGTSEHYNDYRALLGLD